MTTEQTIDIFEGALVTGLTLPTCWVTVEHHALGRNRRRELHARPPCRLRGG